MVNGIFECSVVESLADIRCAENKRINAFFYSIARPTFIILPKMPGKFTNFEKIIFYLPFVKKYLVHM
jgi:hypothetical protein